MLSIEEKEAIMGFPMGHTEHCWNKTDRKQDPVGYDDMRHTLIGIAWSVFVVAVLLQGLCETLSLSENRTVQEVTNLLRPGASSSLNGLLFRPPHQRPTPFQTQEQDPNLSLDLVKKIGTPSVTKCPPKEPT